MRSLVVRPLVVLGIVATLLLVLGRPVAAGLTVVAAVLVVQAALLVPRRLAAVEHRVGNVVGTMISVALLLPVFAIMIAAGAVSRLLGLDPLRSEPRWWPPAEARARRSFADDRRPSRGGPGWRAALALVLLGAVVATVIPPLFDDDGDTEAIPARLRGDSGFSAEESPALADAAWVEEASVEFTEAAAEGSVYAPFVGYALQDYEGRYVNIEDRQRRSYEAQEPTTVEPLDVWFFGGSTMFGFSAQRDEHTIPSEVVRLAEADGLAVRAHNYGGPGMVSFQETVLFTQLLLGSDPPDLVVFYDGINDRAVQLLNAYAGVGRVGEVSDLSAFNIRQSLAGEVTASGDPPPPLTPLPDLGPPPPAVETVEATIDVYEQGIRLSRAVAADNGVPVLHFWQPDLFLKDELVPGEQELLEPLHLDGGRLEAMRILAEATRDRLPSSVTDLSDAFDGEVEPIMTDQVHTNELGARLVAEAMYAHLVPDLTRLAAGP